jgi:hypothetical protein
MDSYEKCSLSNIIPIYCFDMDVQQNKKTDRSLISSHNMSEQSQQYTSYLIPMVKKSRLGVWNFHLWLSS